MAILSECPICHTKQSHKNKKCKCGENLDKAKKSGRVCLWIDYRSPSGRQVRESAKTTSIEEARLFESERKVLKSTKPEILEQATGKKVTFNQLSVWYLDLTSVKNLKSYDRERVVIENFNKVLGQHLVNKITLDDLECYQDTRRKEKLSSRSIDYETGAAFRMLNKAFDNDKITDANVLKPFKRLKNLLKKGSNVRKRTISFDEYRLLLENAPEHLCAVIVTAYNTGMRAGEILNLCWKSVDLKKKYICLEANDTKESKPKDIPINHHVEKVLVRLGKIRSIKHDFVFTYKNQPIKRIIKSFRSCCDKAEIPYGEGLKDGVTFHDIRRTVKTNMLNASVDKIYRDVILGHSLEGMDAVYMSPSRDDLTEAMKKYTEWLDSKMELEFVDHSVDQGVC
jgi:integrase